MRSRLLALPTVTLALLALPTAAYAAPAIMLSTPMGGAVKDDVPVKATVTDGTFAVTSVIAEIGGVTGPLSAAPDRSWSRTLDIASLPIGPVTLTLTATNANGETTTLTRALAHDRSPTLSVGTPAELVATPSLLLQATCSKADMYVCASVTASIGNTVLATGSALNQTVPVHGLRGELRRG